MKHYILAPLAAALCLSWSASAFSADYVALRIEAENFSSKSDRWVLTDEYFQPVQPDPDPPHNDNASGNANLELLPDTRVTHDDNLNSGGANGNFWSNGNGAPRVDYNVDIPEVGRYLLYVKTYSTGTEDNGIHAGLNGERPESGQRIQSCSKNNWVWTSAQRTDENHCGVAKTIWLDFYQTGPATISFYAREDGFEIDQFVLLNETHDGSLDCFPTPQNKIRCKDIATGDTVSNTELPVTQTIDGNQPGTTPPAPEPTLVDLEIDIDAVGATHFVNDSVEYQVTVSNNSQETANNANASIDLPANLTFNASSDCSASGAEITCAFGNILPGTSNSLVFSATASAAGSFRADAQVSADEQDSDSSNNTDSASINAQISIPDYEASVSLSQSSNASAIGGTNQYTATVTNNGQLQISGAALRVNAGSGFTVQQCAPDCAVPSVDAGDSVTVNFTTVATTAGTHDVAVELVVADDANNSNNFTSLSATVVSAGVAINSNAANGSNVIVLEAEKFNEASVAATDNAPQWFVVDNNFTAFSAQLDPDNASNQNVSGNAYIEALPDLRTDDNSNAIAGASNFVEGGVGATLTYNVFFAAAGTYNVYTLVRPNNSQDSSLHVGLNNSWPATAKSVSVCNPDGNWQWTNNISSNSGCDTTSAATIVVAAPGVHQLMVSQNTDGLELDKIILSLDSLTDLNGTGPVAISTDPSQSTDLSVSSSLANQKLAAGENTDLTVVVSNNGSVNASGVTVTLNGLNTDAAQSGAFDSCTSYEASTICVVNEIAAGQHFTASFGVQAGTSDTSFTTTVNAIQSDNNTANDEAQVTLFAEDGTSDNTETGNTEANKASDSGGGGSLSLWFLLTLTLLISFTFTARFKHIKVRN